ncbi:hypothetical protein [Evansella tamaricis]|uniref:Phage protein n=1 Tax=Evansella tamaricis TaxID=2069301 RepID=A0ABS6JL65_9BACI|nr:hypothetical protein [Evansella tamaricis]MBU9714421.1 hypothetical protein [Evansella tamaricis]
MINDFLNQECLIIPFTKDSYGKPQKGEPIPTPCRIKEEFKMVKNQAAEEVVSKLQFWFSPETEINFDCLIGYKGEHQIISIQPKYHLDGTPNRLVVYC